MGSFWGERSSQVPGFDSGYFRIVSQLKLILNDSPEENMKTVANLGSIQAAQSLKLKLGFAGIEAFIPDEVSAGIAPHLFMSRAGVRVQVAEADEAEAKRIIKDGIDPVDPISEDDAKE